MRCGGLILRCRYSCRHLPLPNSLQFDPAPRAGEPMVSRRVPDYFLVRVSSCDPACPPCLDTGQTCRHAWLDLEFIVDFILL